MLEAEVIDVLVTCFGRNNLHLKVILLLILPRSTCVKSVFYLARRFNYFYKIEQCLSDFRVIINTNKTIKYEVL